MTASAVAGARRWLPAPAPGPWHSKRHGRHAFIGAMLDAGHASPTTTARYDRLGGLLGDYCRVAA